MNREEQITVWDAYVAMYVYLERVYRATGMGELGDLLGAMSLLPDGQTADPGAWPDWISAVSEARTGHPNLGVGLKPKQ